MPAIRRCCVLVTALLLSCGDSKLGPDAGTGPCSDGIDNDGDGLIDFPDDVGCTDESDDEDGAALPACSDNRDNDGDGHIDYPNDPGCSVPQVDNESDDCPDGEGCAQCADGIDNDGNGGMDYPADPGCTAAGDRLEFTDNAVACGQGLTILPLPANGVDSGALAAGSVSNLTTPCGGGMGAPAIAYVFHLANPQVIVATTSDPATTADTVLDLRSAMCAAPTAGLECHDDLGTTNKASTITRSLLPGTYYLIVQGKAATSTGNYSLRVEFFAGEGTACTTVADCGPEMECRIPFGGTAKICTGPVCEDGRDDDGDGKVDFPYDPGCTSSTDADETDVCATTPTNPACPACANGVDDDTDGDTDFPADVTCKSASGTGEACTSSEPVIVATTPQTMGTTSGATNDFTPPKGQFNGHACTTTSTTTSLTAPDRVVQLDVPAMSSLSLRLSPVGFDSAHVLLDGTCGGTPIDCYDNPNNMVLSNVQGGRYYLVIDGYSTASGTFTLNISGSIANGESCESPLAQSGAITCGAGYECTGTVGSRICTRTQCNDGMDNNNDGRTDYPNDPGCATATDSIEDTVCPGPSCPVCSDTLDNDGDLLIDYPMDTGCVTAASTNEGCRETEALLPITTPRTEGTLIGATDDHDPTCVSTNLPDRIYTLDIPTSLQSLVIDTEGSAVDTVLSLMTSTCTEPGLACDDDGGVGTGDSLIQRQFLSAGSYTVAVDSDSTTLDSYILNVKGVILPGGSCESALFASGVLECPPSYGCNGPAGSRVCSASQCFDGIDNSGDGKIDYPNDPGCTSTNDNIEDAVCPGPECPECGDTVDNDGDGTIDHSADGGCASASDDAEGCFDTDGVPSLLMPLTTGTTVGATDDHDPLCVTTVGNDLVYRLEIPALESLTIDTEDSSVGTVLSLMGADCLEPAIACDDDGGVGSGDSLITRTNVPGGVYTIAVDADGSTNNTFNLNVSGVISPGQSCESPLVSTGVLRCSIGFACDGPVGQRTCSLAQCIDGLDNNGDGRTDFPADPGCESFSDGSETTVCPGPNCPVCSDGIDNDADGATDYPMDSTCFNAADTNEACSQIEPVGVVTASVTTGNTTGLSNDAQPSCVTSSTSHTAGDVALQLDLPAMATLNLNLTGISGAHTLYDSTCGGTPVSCSDPTLMSLTNIARGTYYVVIDGSTTDEGEWTLTTTGTVEAGESCEGALFQSGAFSCVAGSLCAGTVGSRTCVTASCNDGIDNDGDGKTDSPNDPGCANTSDDDETDTCPGAGCPVCADGMDNDGDATIDYPMDTSCFNAGDENEACTQVEPIDTIAQMVTTGDTSGLFNDYKPTCGTTSTTTPHSAPDVALQLDVPAMATLNLNLTGANSANLAHALLDSTCGGTALACSNPELMTRTNVAAGTYYVVVDGWSTASGPWTLTTTGTVAPGGNCEGALFQTGAFTCTAGHACQGALGSRTCAPAMCNDTMDNDGDGTTDFPADPGCESSDDNDEVDACPGSGCPVCSNGIDDDADTLIDYPLDLECRSASFFVENFCSIEANVAGVISQPTTSGTLVGAADNYDQSCQSNTGNDVSYALDLPVPVASLVLDTIGSTTSDTVLSVKDLTCGTEIGCDDDSDPASARSLLTLTNVAAGIYAVQVDGYSTSNNGAFLLNVRGTVAAGTACTSPLFASGVLACPTGTTCTSGTCQ